MKNPFANLFKKKKKDDANAPPVPQGGESKKKEGFFSKLLKNRLGKQSIKGEEILGVELTPSEIRLSQVSSNKANQWVLDKFYVHKFEGIPENGTVLENPDKVAEELKLALQKSKINTTNAAIAIPVTSAIIRVVTAPLMTDEELKKAIDTDSLWENLVQLTDNLNDYSIFHQVINRDKTGNTMDILFVASKLSDINNLTAVLEFGLDENYVMILYENNPIITDIFIRSQDRKTLQESNNQEEMDALVRRYMTQVKQAVQDFEQKYEKRIRNLKVTSNLQNVEDYLGSFRKNMVNTGYNLFDPFDGIKIPAQLENDIKMDNRSYFSTVMGLEFRKLDVFVYY